MNSHARFRTVWASAALLAVPLVLAGARAAVADERADAKQLVEKAQLTLQSFMCDGKMAAFRDLLPKAKGVLIVPQLLKGAFVVGASGGSGVLMVREATSKTWSEPAFYTLGGVSFGFQAGGESSEVILLAMTERGVQAFQDTSIKLGGDVGLAAGPIGMGAAAATANLSADILSFSRSKGLYGGVSLDGAVVAVREGVNRAYYGKDATPMDILVRHAVTNSQGAALAEVLAKSAAGSEAARNCSGAPGKTEG